MSKKLPLPHGLFAIIDDDDFERVGKFKWYVSDRGYVASHIRKIDGSMTGQYLHRFIMNAPDDLDVDHIHGNKLDNRKSELRLCTDCQNLYNRGKQKNNTSGFKGVFWHKQLFKWRAQIVVDGKQIHLGLFTDINEAAAAYAAVALKYHGEFAHL